jgi:hypothetical protein
MMNNTTKPDSLQPAAEKAGDLFDNWFDPIETEVRARGRDWRRMSCRSSFIRISRAGSSDSTLGAANLHDGDAFIQIPALHPDEGNEGSRWPGLAP